MDPPGYCHDEPPEVERQAARMSFARPVQAVFHSNNKEAAAFGSEGAALSRQQSCCPSYRQLTLGF
jgi:hypothetical protein